MKYKVLVADDEYIIRSGIISLLEKYEELEVVAEAEDGEMALEEVKKQEIDLLFVDINMPFLSGLEFIKQLRTLQPDAVVSIITGYDVFEYARQAINLGVAEYILKPVMEEEFEEAVHRLLDQLNKRQSEEKYLEWAKSTLKKNRNHLISEFLESCIDGHVDVVEAKQRLNYLDIEFPESYIVTMIRIEYQDTQDVENQWNDDLLVYAVLNIANEIFENMQNLVVVRKDSDDIVLITKLEEQKELDERNQKCMAVIDAYLPVTIQMMQAQGNGIEQLQMTYEEAYHHLTDINKCSNIIKQVQNYINEHYAIETFSLTDVAKELHLSTQHLSRLFRKEIGITFIDYLTKVRMRKAIELLYEDEIMMYEIAERVGYSSQHYFSHVFKKNMGISPNEYKKNIKNVKISQF